MLTTPPGGVRAPCSRPHLMLDPRLRHDKLTLAQVGPALLGEGQVLVRRHALRDRHERRRRPRHDCLAAAGAIRSRDGRSSAMGILGGYGRIE